VKAYDLVANDMNAYALKPARDTLRAQPPVEGERVGVELSSADNGVRQRKRGGRERGGGLFSLVSFPHWKS